MKQNEDYRLFKADLVELHDDKGNKIFISPLHPKYKELKQIESERYER